MNMKRLIPILLVAVALLPLTAKAQESDIYEISGAANIQFCEKLAYNNESSNFREGFCLGIINATMSTLIVYGNICLPARSSIGQGARVVVAFMERHPELLHEPMTQLAIDAFLDAFPCRGSGSRAR